MVSWLRFFLTALCGKYQLIGITLFVDEDDDECALGRHNCVKPFECRNTKGSFRCEKPRIITTTSTTTTSTTTTTTKRPYIHTQYYPSSPTYTQSYSNRYTAVWPHTTSNPRHIEYDQRYGPCSVGFQRNNQGACVGKSTIDQYFTGIKIKFNADNCAHNRYGRMLAKQSL